MYKYLSDLNFSISLNIYMYTQNVKDSSIKSSKQNLKTKANNILAITFIKLINFDNLKIQIIKFLN